MELDVVLVVEVEAAGTVEVVAAAGTVEVAAAGTVEVVAAAGTVEAVDDTYKVEVGSNADAYMVEVEVVKM